MSNSSPTNSSSSESEEPQPIAKKKLVQKKKTSAPVPAALDSDSSELYSSPPQPTTEDPIQVEIRPHQVNGYNVKCSDELKGILLEFPSPLPFTMPVKCSLLSVDASTGKESEEGLKECIIHVQKPAKAGKYQHLLKVKLIIRMRDFDSEQEFVLHIVIGDSVYFFKTNKFKVVCQRNRIGLQEGKNKSLEGKTKSLEGKTKSPKETPVSSEKIQKLEKKEKTLRRKFNEKLTKIKQMISVEREKEIKKIKAIPERNNNAMKKAKMEEDLTSFYLSNLKD